MPAERTVTVTKEQRHQATLRRYVPDLGWPSQQMVADLRYCTITSGRYAGQRAIEVCFDGERVGELTYLMSVRYRPFVDAVLARHETPACEADVFANERGVQVEIRLPAVHDHDQRPARQADQPSTDQLATVRIPRPRSAERRGTGVPAAWPTGQDAQPAPSAITWGPPPHHRAARPRARHKPYWIGAGAVGVVLLIGIAANAGTPRTPTSPSTATSKASVPTTSLPAPPAAPATSAAPSTKIATAPPTQTRAPAPRPTPPAPAGCHANYSGCVPIASDVDCEGGSGNGPAYVSGPIRVTGSDVYGLDSDNDGVACE